MSVTSDAPRLLGDVAYERIKRDIVRCELEPGREITESQVTARYGLSKGPVRAALLRLYQEGLVQPWPRRGYLIRPVTVQAVRDLFQLRLLLEPAVARLATGRVDGERLRRLDAACRGGYDPSNRRRSAAFLAANRAFHVTIAEAAGNALLTATMAKILDEMERLFHLGFSATGATREPRREHEALIEALTSGDAETAERATRQHIETSQHMIMDAILSSPAAARINVAEPRVSTPRIGGARS